MGDAAAGRGVLWKIEDWERVWIVVAGEVSGFRIERFPERSRGSVLVGEEPAERGGLLTD